MITVQDLTKYYGLTQAISRLTFEVGQGEIVGFLGPNGAGKTTTLKILAGFMPPTSGKALINGHDCVTESLAVRRSLGYLPETAPLYTELTVSQFLRFAARAKGVETKHEHAEVDRVIEDCGLEEVRDTLISSLSKGFRQREPTIGLDPAQIVEIRQLIKDLSGDHTVVLSSHILPEVSQLCQRVIIINKGQIIASDTPENLSRQLGHGSRQRVEVKGPASEVMEALKGLPGVKEVIHQGETTFLVESGDDLELRPEIARLVVARGWDLLAMQIQEFTLEEVFLNLVTEEEA
ncbi:MAG: ATP-binding cassette domain-containing protein [Syntrophobacterales bacterium]